MDIPTAVQRAAATYDAASDAYDHPANSFWGHFGSKTVDRIGLRPGDRVLDVCCGSGASAIPAARKVGPTGTVIGVDVAARLLDLARLKAASARLANADFFCSDLMLLDKSLGTFDAVVCVFGIFFLPDIPAALSHLWNFVKPGGLLAITTWGPRFFEPANSVFWDSIHSERPDLDRGFNPWDKLVTPAALTSEFESAGLPEPLIEAFSSKHSIPTSQDWWTAVLGSGYRGTLMQLAPDQLERVRLRNTTRVDEMGIREIETNVIFAALSK